MAKHIVNSFTVTSAVAWQHSDGDPPNAGIECKGYDKIPIFDQYLDIPQKRYEIQTVSMEY